MEGGVEGEQAVNHASIIEAFRTSDQPCWTLVLSLNAYLSLRERLRAKGVAFVSFAYPRGVSYEAKQHEVRIVGIGRAPNAQAEELTADLAAWWAETMLRHRRPHEYGCSA